MRNSMAMKFFKCCGRDADPYLENMRSKSKAVVTFSRQNKCGAQVCVNFFLPARDFKATLTSCTYEHAMQTT